MSTHFVNALTQNSLGLQNMINKHKSEMGFFRAPKHHKCNKRFIPVTFTNSFVNAPSKIMVFKLCPEDGNLNYVSAAKDAGHCDKFDNTTYFLYDECVSFTPNSEWHQKQHHNCWAPAYFRYVSDVSGAGFNLHYFPQDPPSSASCSPCDRKHKEHYKGRDKNVYVYIAYA